jgi:hypothetical protein
MVEDRWVNRGEFLQTAHSPETEHRPLPSSKRQVRILRTIVPPTTGFLPVADAKFLERSAIGAEAIRHQLLGATVAFQRFLEKISKQPSCRASSSRSFQAPLPRGRRPAKDSAARPLILTRTSSRCHRQRLDRIPKNPPFPDFCGENRTESVPPEPHGLVADLDAAFVQQILDIAQRQREPHIHHHRQADDLGRGFEVPKRR